MELLFFFFTDLLFPQTSSGTAVNDESSIFCCTTWNKLVVYGGITFFSSNNQLNLALASRTRELKASGRKWRGWGGLQYCTLYSVVCVLSFKNLTKFYTLGELYTHCLLFESLKRERERERERDGGRHTRWTDNQRHLSGKQQQHRATTQGSKSGRRATFCHVHRKRNVAPN